MAVAIFVDAVVIRCLIVPAAMELMGRRAWWLPRRWPGCCPRSSWSGTRRGATGRPFADGPPRR